MATSLAPSSDVYDAVRRLEEDLRQKGLAAGTRYLTAAEAGAMLGVSTATAHRAMAVLARRQMLVRRRHSGTFVGTHFAGPHKPRVCTLYAIISAAMRHRAGYPFDLFIRGIADRLEDVNVQICFLPASDSLGYLRELIDSAKAAGETAGVVAISCPREVYRMLADSKLPMVIHGSAYLDQQDIPSVDVDNREAGRLLTEHLIQRGHRRMALLCVTDHLPGDNLFFDGTSEALTAARLPHNALIVRGIPLDPEAFASEIQRLLEADDRPTAFIVRNPDSAPVALAAVRKARGLAAPVDFVCYANQPLPEAVFPYAHVVPRISFTEIVGQIAVMLDRLSRGLPLETARVVIPVELQTPENLSQNPSQTARLTTALSARTRSGIGSKHTSRGGRPCRTRTKRNRT